MVDVEGGEINLVIKDKKINVTIAEDMYFVVDCHDYNVVVLLIMVWLFDFLLELVRFTEFIPVVYVHYDERTINESKEKSFLVIIHVEWWYTLVEVLVLLLYLTIEYIPYLDLFIGTGIKFKCQSNKIISNDEWLIGYLQILYVTVLVFLNLSSNEKEWLSLFLIDDVVEVVVDLIELFFEVYWLSDLEVLEIENLYRLLWIHWDYVSRIETKLYGNNRGHVTIELKYRTIDIWIPNKQLMINWTRYKYNKIFIKRHTKYTLLMITRVFSFFLVVYCIP